MSEEWLPLPTAITFVAEAKGITKGEAIPLLIRLAQDARVASRIALMTDKVSFQLERNVPMFQGHWQDLIELDTDWLSTGNAEWREEYAWLGIEIHAGDLAINLGTRHRQTKGNLQPVAQHEASSNQIQEPQEGWHELWQGPFHFRATFDKGKVGPGSTIDAFNRFAEEGSTGGGRHTPIYCLKVDPEDGAFVIDWLNSHSAGSPRTVRYYWAGIGRGLYERLYSDKEARDAYLNFMPAGDRVRATGAFATAVSIQEWMKREFFDAVSLGACEIWARVGSRTAPFSRIPGDAFAAYEVQSWGQGKVGAAWATLEGEQSLYSIRVASPAQGQIRADGVSAGSQTPRRRGRARGTGFQKADAAILEKMRQAIEADPALNATSAARIFADEAPGASFDARVDRLSRGYREKWGA